jgi:signal transduction histidine kinase
MCIADGAGLTRFRDDIIARREEEQPGILPVVLLTRRREVWSGTPDLWQVVDEAISMPISRLEFQARIEILLRARRISMELKLRNEDQEAFIQAMSHDLRASLRAISMFGDTIAQSEAARLSDAGRQDLDRIFTAVEDMRELIDSLLNFSRLGRGEVRYEPIDLRGYVRACLRNLEADIRRRNAEVHLKVSPRAVLADPALLKIALTNLLSNAIKFVPEGVRPEITVSTTVKSGICRIQVDDNGIGISQENHQRIFMPFVRLFSEEDFPGIGLGLPTVRKAVELMGGRVGVESSPGRGSTFWIEFNL